MRRAHRGEGLRTNRRTYVPPFLRSQRTGVSLGYAAGNVEHQNSPLIKTKGVVSMSPKLNTFSMKALAGQSSGARLRRTRCLGGALLWTIVVIAAVGSNRLFAAELAIPTTVAAGGTPVTVSIEYRPQGDAVAALQFDLAYDSTVIYVSPAWHVGTAAADAAKAVVSNNLPNGTIRFVVSGLNQNVIGMGSIVDLIIVVSGTAQPGPYKLELLNVSGAAPDGQLVPIKVQEGRVIVVPANR